MSVKPKCPSCGQGGSPELVNFDKDQAPLQMLICEDCGSILGVIERESSWVSSAQVTAD